MSDELPEPEPLEPDKASKKEAVDLFGAGLALDLNLRRIAGYGAIAVATILYGVGVCLAVAFSQPAPLGLSVPSWHVVAATLAALFTVPTVLVLAVLRSTSKSTKDPEADSLHAAIGTKVMAWLDKIVDGVVKP